MAFPSGDHTGEESEVSLADVSCRGVPPSIDTSHKLVALLLVSGFQLRTVKTIQRPSGDGRGSPTRCMRTISWMLKACGLVRSGAAAPCVVSDFVWAVAVPIGVAVNPNKNAIANDPLDHRRQSTMMRNMVPSFRCKVG